MVAGTALYGEGAEMRAAGEAGGVSVTVICGVKCPWRRRPRSRRNGGPDGAIS